MNSLIIAAGAAALYLVAYYTYGRFLARKIFRLDPSRLCPSRALEDGVDYVPTERPVLFGHHFTSIAGTGPLVGPAIAIIWGWVPALLWILVGSVFMGAVHDFGALVVSLRNQGRSVGDIASDLISHRVRLLFLVIIFFELWIVVAVFGMVIAIVFQMYPEAVIPVWLEVPIAVWMGRLVARRRASRRAISAVAVIVLYLSMILGVAFPLKMPAVAGLDPLAVWVIVLLVYAYAASVLPVQTLLQPRDYINAHQLFVAMGLLGLGVVVSRPDMVAPAFNPSPPGAPPLIPMLFVVVACGAVSGFHALVSSGTSSKQCDSESSALSIGFGSMLTEGMLAVLVLVCCGAGLAMGLQKGGETFTGLAAFSQQYAGWAQASGLGAKIGAFVQGAANLIGSLGVPLKFTLTIMGVFVVSFAATTLDTATRLQRYVVAELAQALRVPALGRKHPATLIAVGSAFLLAFHEGSGKGALALWPLFGSVNQLLAGLALLVITTYLARRRAPVVYTLVPMAFMILMTGAAMLINLAEMFDAGDWALVAVGTSVLVLELWMIWETVRVLRTVGLGGRGQPPSPRI